MFIRPEIAGEADKYQKSLLTADEGCHYDSVIEINLDTVKTQLFRDCHLTYFIIVRLVIGFFFTPRCHYIWRCRWAAQASNNYVKHCQRAL